MPQANQLRQKRQNMGTEKIYQLDGGGGVGLWLCDNPREARVAANGTLKESKDPPHPVGCDDCRREL